MEIRKATLQDRNELAILMGELGYPTTEEQMIILFNHIEYLE